MPYRLSGVTWETMEDDEERKPVFLGGLVQESQISQTSKSVFRAQVRLGETDPFLPPPRLNGLINVRCDDCGQEYSYHLDDLLRVELELPDFFIPHPFFL